jgi:hypothetical protein
LQCAQVRLRAHGAAGGACGCLFDVKTGGNAAQIALGGRGVVVMDVGKGDDTGMPECV